MKAINEGLGKAPKFGTPEYPIFMKELMRRRRKRLYVYRKCSACGKVHRCGAKP